MMTIEEKREKVRLRNIAWRTNTDGYLRAAAKWRNNNREKIMDYKLKTKYGISAEQYALMLEKQDGKCAICKNPEVATHNYTKTAQRLAVDHCHKTGKVRGLLCQDCNRGISKFHEEVSRLQGAIEYLTFHQK